MSQNNLLQIIDNFLKKTKRIRIRFYSLNFKSLNCIRSCIKRSSSFRKIITFINQHLLEIFAYFSSLFFRSKDSSYNHPLWRGTLLYVEILVQDSLLHICLKNSSYKSFFSLLLCYLISILKLPLLFFLYYIYHHCYYYCCCCCCFSDIHFFSAACRHV